LLLLRFGLSMSGKMLAEAKNNGSGSRDEDNLMGV
jgi:hypothetical protein